MPVVEPTPTPTPTPEPSPTPAPEPTPAPNPQTATKPDGLPDKYWDATAGLRTKEVGETLSAFEAEQARIAETFKDFPDKPEEAGKFYQLPENLLPEGVTLPEGIEFKPNEQLLAGALPILHKHKAAPELFHDLTRAFNAYELAQYQNAQTEFAEDNKKLGANGSQRRQALATGLKGMVGDKADFIDTSAITSKAVEFFEAVMEKFTNQSNVVPLHQKRDEDPAPTSDKPLIDRLADSMYPKRAS